MTLPSCLPIVILSLCMTSFLLFSLSSFLFLNKCNPSWTYTALSLSGKEKNIKRMWRKPIKGKMNKKNNKVKNKWNVISPTNYIFNNKNIQICRIFLKYLHSLLNNLSVLVNFACFFSVFIFFSIYCFITLSLIFLSLPLSLHYKFSQ